MLNENRLYSISFGVASLQDGLVGVATALSPAMAGHFKFLLHHFFVRLGLIVIEIERSKSDESFRCFNIGRIAGFNARFDSFCEGCGVGENSLTRQQRAVGCRGRVPAQLRSNPWTRRGSLSCLGG